MVSRFIVYSFFLCVVSFNVLCMENYFIYTKKVNSERYYPFPCSINKTKPSFDAESFIPKNTDIYYPGDLEKIDDKKLRNKFIFHGIRGDYSFMGEVSIHFYFRPGPLIPTRFFENLFLLWNNWYIYSRERTFLPDHKQFIVNYNQKRYRKIIVLIAPYLLTFLDNNSVHYVSPVLPTSVIAIAVPPDIKENIERNQKIPYEKIIVYPILATLNQTIINWNAFKWDLVNKNFTVYVSKKMNNFLENDAKRMVSYPDLLSKQNGWWASDDVYKCIEESILL
jgi:hypothetical protein